ncbi:hypothetical protein D9756_004311 [Leucocoprinus leucothites]|uniref:Glyoxal oxidase n=1 Tax=Leucocoprinus leucothites TaxID=201217 RepID=A0A8H5D933_9AGAR|nr:hypothetical protein D9756_004311 [Leucoagaricus leucothites]
MDWNARFPRFIALLLAARSASAAANKGWHFVQNGTSGIVALESIIVSDTLALFFDRATNDPMQIDNHTAWGAVWNLETNTARPLEMKTDSFCASGSFLSNGTMVSVGGHRGTVVPQAGDGLMGVRIWEPCEDPTGESCTLFDDPSVIHLAEDRWYPSSCRIFDGSLFVAGGMHVPTPFYNTDPANTYEFWPPKDGGATRPSAFLARAGPSNMFPRTIALPDGRIWIAAGNQTIIYDVEKNTETILPSIPNNIQVTNPMDGTAGLLPLHPPDYIPEVLVCGGSPSDPATPHLQLSSQDPATDQCSRMTLTEEGIKKGWEIEHMLEPRTMPEFILLPNGKILIVNGGQTGYAAFNSTKDPIGQSNADHPAFTPSIYDPDARLGQRISNEGMPSTDIPRLYHSTATLTPSGNIMIGGNNPNGAIVYDIKYTSEFRIEYLNPPYMTMDRPVISNVPKQIDYNSKIHFNISIPSSLRGEHIQVALMDLGFSTHAFHSSSRLVFMDATLSRDGESLTVTTPPNNRVYPPGPAYIYVTVGDVSSVGARTLIGNGQAPPVADQGVPLGSHHHH